MLESKPTEKADGESAVLAAIAAMAELYRAMGERLHAIITASAPVLSMRLWCGLPAYAKGGKIVCFFSGGDKFKERFMTLGFEREANLDEHYLWPVVFALTKLTAAEEERTAALVKKKAKLKATPLARLATDQVKAIAARRAYGIQVQHAQDVARGPSRMEIKEPAAGPLRFLRAPCHEIDRVARP